MTDYTDVISLEEAKLYLRIDEDQTATDDEITQMICSALSFIERKTNHIFKTREKVYYKDCALVNHATVYDYPIDNLETEYNITYRINKAIVPTVNGFVTLTIGYDSVDDIPTELIDCALQIINFWYYNSETKNSVNSIPDFVMEVINQNRRFV